MYTEGNIIYFKLFHFKNGKLPKPKYFLVLKVVDDDSVLVSLPSSVESIPRSVDIKHGCLTIPEASICCYVFKSGIEITKNNWSFPRDTFLYGQYIEDYKTSTLEEMYPSEGIDHEIKGRLTDVEMQRVVTCFSESTVVKRRYKRILAGS